MTRIAVIDIGKTNAKLALVDGDSLSEIAVLTRPNLALPGPPWPHTDLDGLWQFFLDGLTQFQRGHGIDALSVTTHGAAAVLLDKEGALAAPMLDYEHPGPDMLADAYQGLRPDFALTGSPRLPMGLNLGAQLHWLMQTQPDLRARTAHVLTYPQYWGWRLTGQMASDVTSLGCHTDLWAPWQDSFSPLAERLGLVGLLAPPRRPDDILGGLLPQVAQLTGIPAGSPVAVGIHDSNASLYPYLLGRPQPFAVVSTGTWVVAMAVGGRKTALDPTRDVLVNVNAKGQPVPSARFMGGREFEMIREGCTAIPTAGDHIGVLAEGIMILPSIQKGSGPFQGRDMIWTAPPQTSGQRMVALSWYLALMTQTCLDLAGAEGPVIVEGPFARNREYLDMLAAICPGGVEIAASATGTSVGAAMLCLPEARGPATTAHPLPPAVAELRAYAAAWGQRLA